MKRAFRKGQSVTEVALLIGVVSLVLIGMEVYFRRGISGKIKDMADAWIGKEQAVYQQDASGLEINTSGSTYVLDSTTTLTEEKDGKKALKTPNETAVTTYSSTAKDSGN